MHQEFAIVWPVETTGRRPWQALVLSLIKNSYPTHHTFPASSFDKLVLIHIFRWRRRLKTGKRERNKMTHLKKNCLDCLIFFFCISKKTFNSICYTLVLLWTQNPCALSTLLSKEAGSCYLLWQLHNFSHFASSSLCAPWKIPFK